MSPKTARKSTGSDILRDGAGLLLTTPDELTVLADPPVEPAPIEDFRVRAGDLTIEMIPIDSVRQHPRNNNTGDSDAIAESITELGFFDPISVQRSTGLILTGNHSWEEYRRQGATEIPGIMLDVDDVQAARIMIAHNRTNRRGRDDEAATLELLQWLEEEAGTPYVLVGTGYTTEDIDAMLSEAAGPAITVLDPVLPPDDEEPAEPPAEPVTVRGDVWQLGEHRIVCGDCRDFDTVASLLNGRLIDVAFTSPPYASQRVYDPTSGFEPVRPDDYEDWFEDVQANIRANLADTGSWFVNIKEHVEDGQRHLYVRDLTVAHVRRWGWRFVDEFVWTRMPPPGRWPDRFKNKWEPVFHFAMPGAIKFRPEAVAHPSDEIPISLSQGSKQPVDLSVGTYWNISNESQSGMALPGNVLEFHGIERETGHSAAFPVKLPSWFIRAFTDDGDVVFDPFMGSGSTLLAAHSTGRIGFGTEISPGYCDVICKRFQRHTGITPRRDGVAHDFLDGEQ